LIEDAIQHEVELIIKSTHNAITVGRALEYWESTGLSIQHPAYYPTVRAKVDIEQVLLRPPLISALMHRVENLRAIGGFDEKLIIRDDYDLFVRLMLNQHIPVFFDRKVTIYRHLNRENRVSRRRDSQRYDNELYLFQKLYSLIVESPHTQSEIRNGIAASAWITARDTFRCGYRSHAESLFDISREMGLGRPVGRLPYRLLCSVLGPMKTEYLVTALKSYTFMLSQNNVDES
jgi:hypothetical protein